MQRFIQKKAYEAQAMAVVLIVLIVGVIIALAIVSRVLTDQKKIVEEKASAEALELSDSLIDVTSRVSIGDAESWCTSKGMSLQSGCTVSGVDDINSLFADNSISNNLLDGFDTCDLNDITVKFELSDPNDEFEIEQDDVLGIVFSGQAPSSNSCTTMNVRDISSKGGASKYGLIVSNIYANDNNGDGIVDEFKPYAYNDKNAYCMQSSCPDNLNWSGSWTYQNPSSTLAVDLGQKSGGAPVPASYNLREVRLRAVNSDVGLKLSFVRNGASCNAGVRIVKVTASATCQDSFRGKTVLIPENDWAMPIFDYVLFNGNGVLHQE